MFEYGRAEEDESVAVKMAAEPVHHLAETGRLPAPPPSPPASRRSSPVEELGLAGHTDRRAMMQRFLGGEGVIGGMDCVSSSWTTDAPGGFTEPQVAELRRLVPVLALAIKSASLARIAATLVETYLGRDAGRRVLAGKDRTRRGRPDQRRARPWTCAATPTSPTPRCPSRSSRCSTTMPRR